MKAKPKKNLPAATPARKDLGKKISDLKNKLKELAAEKALKKRKKDPVMGQILKLRRQLIQADGVFESDKERVPLEILSLTKRLVFSINQFEEQLAMEKAAAAEGETPAPAEVVF
jgi:hypothetical protein